MGHTFTLVVKCGSQNYGESVKTCDNFMEIDDSS